MLARISIRRQLLLLVLAVVLPVTGLLAYTLHTALGEARLGAGRQLLALAHDTAGRIDVVLQRRAELMARLAERPLVRALDARRCDAALGEVAAMQTEFVSLAVHGKDGEVLCTSRTIAPAGPATAAAGAAQAARAAPWFPAGLGSSGFAVGGAFANPPDSRWVTMLTHPVRDAAGEIGGLLVLAIDLQALQRQLLPVLPPDTIVVAFDREWRYLMRTIEPSRWIGQPLPQPQRAQVQARDGTLFELTGVDGVARLNVGADVPSSGWRVFAALPVDRVYAGYRALLQRSLILGGATLVGVGLLAWGIGRRITRPIDALAAGAATVAGGHAVALSDAGSSEVAAVAADLQQLAAERAQLQNRHARLSASYEQMADAARDIVLVVDAQDERIVQANPAALAAYGYSREELLGMPVIELRAPAALGQFAQDRSAALRPQGALYETEHRRKDGSSFPVEVSVRAFDAGGHRYFQNFIRDATRRKRNEALLAGQRAVLALVAQGAPLAESLDALARLVEAQAPGLVATILLLDDDGVHLRHGAAPSLPRAFMDAIDGAAIGPVAGACGTAAHRREPVVSEDIGTDPLWVDWRALALAQGLHACWSTPIVDAAGQVLGTFALYYRQPGRPDDAHQRLVDLVTYTAAIAIVSARAARRERAQLDELLHWQSLMVAREERMRALKAEVDALCQRLTEPPRYGGGEEP